MSTDTPALRPERTAELRWAALKIGGALAICGGLYALYSREVRVEGEVQDLLAGQKIAGGVRAGGAKSDLNKDTARGLLSAETSVQRALELQPSNPYAVAALADVEVQLAGLGYDGRAAKGDEALVRAEGKEVNLPERYEAHALRLLQQGKAAEAESYLLALFDRFPNAGSNPKLINVLGRAQRAQGKLAEARQAIKKAQDADWRAPRLVTDYGEILLEDGNPADAANAFDRALQANGDHLRAQKGKARAILALFHDGRSVDPKQAVALCDAILQHPAEELPQPVKAEALAVRAEAKVAAGDQEGASRDLADAMLTGGRLPAVLRARAVIAAANKAPDAADLFKEAALAAPYDPSIYFDGATALSAAGDNAGAEKLLGAYAARLPQNARFHLFLGRLLADRDPKAAAAAFAKAQQLEPTNAMVYYEQGRLARKQRDQKGAVAAFEKAVQLREDFPDVYRQMGTLYLEQKQTEQAIRVFNEALLRYKASRVSAPVLEAFYAEVVAQVSKAGSKKLAEQWVKEARAMR